MERDERALWNEKYRSGSHTSLEPDSFLVDAYSGYLAGQPPGDALDVAGGAGRHALWLVQRGWRVKLIDVSETGIALAQANTQEIPTHSGLLEALPCGQIETRQLDLNKVSDLGHEQYDLVLVFFYLRRELFPAILAALRPGGLLIYKTYAAGQLQLGGGPRDPDYLLEPGELRQAFQSMHILRYLEQVGSIATAELVARKLPRSQ